MTKKNGTARHVRISKYLSKHLRHQPERLGLELATGGWVDVDRLLTACARHGFPISRAELEAVVASDDKQRFSVDEHGTRIRANQGHSVEVELELEPAVPPAVLYHGTGHGAAELIVKAGIRRMARHHVHLSPDVTTATTVGSRHGQPVVFEVDAGAMHRAGHTFYLSSNGVWLVDVVPPQYVRRL